MTDLWPAVWRARWIWPEVPEPADGSRHRTAHLRREVTLAEVPPAVPFRATADSRFVLSVNGREVARGPARSAPERPAYETGDLAPYLRPGVNEIVAMARHYGTAMPWWRPVRPAGQLGHGSFAFEAPAIGLCSDESWQGLVTESLLAAPAPDPIAPRAEIVDGAGLPGPGSAWTACTALAGAAFVADPLALPGPPFSVLEPSGLPAATALPLELRPLGEVTLPPAAPAADPVQAYVAAREAAAGGAGETWQTYDVGGITIGTIWVEASGPAGSVVDVYAGEDLLRGGIVEAAPRWFALRYVIRGDGAPERHESFDGVGFRYVSAVGRGRAKVSGVGAFERRHPTAGGARFACDDERLTQIWRTGARTLEVCATDAFLDCPGREQNAWVGDSYLHTLLTLVTTGDLRLLRRHLRLCAQSPRADGFLPMIAAGDPGRPLACTEYSLHWVRAVARYHEHTGDRGLVRELLPDLLRVLDAFERFRGEDGLLHGVAGLFIDWAMVERGEVTGALDALYAAALDDAAALVPAELAAELTGRAKRTREAFERLWDAERGVYVDVLGGRRVSQQTNAAAIVGGCAPEDRWAGILERILDPQRVRLTPTPADLEELHAWLALNLDPERFGFDEERDVVKAQPFFTHFVHQALARAGRRDLIAASCLQWWPQLERGNTTLEEYWNAASGRASRAHAWSGTPTYDLTAHVLGFSPLEAGCGRIAIRPRFGALGRIEAVVPTPHGEVSIELTRAGGTVAIPAGVTADFEFEDAPLPARTLGPGRHELKALEVPAC